MRRGRGRKLEARSRQQKNCLEVSRGKAIASSSISLLSTPPEVINDSPVSNAKIFPPLFKLLQFSSPQYLRDTIAIQPSRSTRSSETWTTWSLSSVRQTAPVQSRLKITNRSFRHAAPQLWNKLPHSLRVPYQSGSSLSSLSVLRLQR